MRANPGQRDALLAILLEGTVAMPGRSAAMISLSGSAEFSLVGQKAISSQTTPTSV